MIHYQKLYIRVKGEEFPGKSHLVLQLDSPQLIGIIRIFPNTPQGEANRLEYLTSANLDLTGKADSHRVFCHPYGSAQKLGNQVSPGEIRRVMAEMADFYVYEMSEEKREVLKDNEPL